ncbi:MAG: hypothetical protein M3N26_11950 [Pseudomonadota bacterium]|nr:hypothetical protein [Pseudomonadota bacterium]
MNRLNLAHTGSRIDLPESIRLPVAAFKRPVRAPLIAPVTRFYLAIAGFMGCGAAVILTASLIALRIQ